MDTYNFKADLSDDLLRKKEREEAKNLVTESTSSVSVKNCIDFIQKDFRTIQRLYRAEFNRDWNLFNPQGNQQQIGVGLTLKNKEEDYLQEID